MLQVPPTGAPAARVPSRAPQSDPSDPAFAGLMAQAGLAGPLPAARAAEAPARTTETEGSAPSPDRAAKKALAPGDKAEEASSPERPESTDPVPEAEKEAAQASAAPAAPESSTPAPVVPDGRAMALLAETAALPPAPVAAVPPSMAEAPPQADLPVSAISKATADLPPPVPAEPRATAAPPVQDPVPAPAPRAAVPEPSPALPEPAPATAAPKAETPVAEPTPPADVPAPLPPAPAGESPAKSSAGPAAQAAQSAQASLQPQRTGADTPAPTGRSTTIQFADAGSRIQEPNPGGGSQSSSGDLAQGLKGRLTLMAEPATVVSKEAQPIFQLPGAPMDAPAPAPLRKPQAAPPADETPRKAGDAAPAQPASEAKHPATAASSPKDPGVALPRTESMGLQPAQGGAGPVASLQSAPAKATVQMQWQAPVPSLVNQVEGGIRWMLRTSTQGAELQLHPENLGRVRIELRVEGSDVHARVWASDPKSLPVLQDNKAFLEVSLKEQGLNLGSFDLRQNSQQAQTRQQSGDGSGQFWATEAPKADFRQETPIHAGAVAAQARRLEIFA